MPLIKFAGFFVLTTLTLQNIEVKSSLQLDTDKDNVLKAPEKRSSKIHLNVGNPFEPNFWPTRGRRARRGPEKPNDDCLTTDDYFGLQCPQNQISKKSDPDIAFNDPEIFTDIGRSSSDYYGNLVDLKPEGDKRKSVLDEMDAKTSHKFSQFLNSKRRRQKILPVSKFWANGNGFYYEPDDPFGEKMKKQDVFWVVRGKKNFQ